ncbi:MAG: hypothetical protein J2P25_13910 [Nocardiopsaceae bacterium]|nr:hypothetical protein [Nocardiopsaceae bacterium]
MNDRPPLRDYSQSLAVVMGAWDYAHLDRVPAARHSLRRMERLLTGPLCGWPRDRVLVLPNVSSAGDVPDRLITAFDAVTDVALFYFVGHGQIAPDDQLCLGLAQSRPEPNRRAATSLRFADVRQALLDSSAAVKIVILDCCFAGLETRSTLAPGVLDDLTAGTGAYTMAATGAYTTAWYQDEPGLSKPQTYFTKYLADLIEEGIPGQPTRLRMDPLFRRLRDNLAADGRPVPHRRAVDGAREYAFAYNAAPPSTYRDPERELAAADAQISALKAQAAERERELVRLQELLASARSHDAGQHRELQDAVKDASRQLDETRAAQAHLVEAHPPLPDTAGTRDSPHSAFTPQQAPHTAEPEIKPTYMPDPSSSWRSGKLWRQIHTRKRLSLTVVAAISIATATALIVLLTPGTPSVNLAYALTNPTPGIGGVESVAFTTNGTTLATGDANGNTYLWNIPKGSS